MVLFVLIRNVHMGLRLKPPDFQSLVGVAHKRSKRKAFLTAQLSSCNDDATALSDSSRKMYAPSPSPLLYRTCRISYLGSSTRLAAAAVLRFSQAHRTRHLLRLSSTTFFDPDDALHGTSSFSLAAGTTALSQTQAPSSRHQCTIFDCRLFVLSYSI
jgi:hypothetical protein